jgi:hypothetical protein
MLNCAWAINLIPLLHLSGSKFVYFPNTCTCAQVQVFVVVLALVARGGVRDPPPVSDRLGAVAAILARGGVRDPPPVSDRLGAVMEVSR